MVYYAVLLVPAHADSGVKPTARYAETWTTARRWIWNPRAF